MMINTSTTKKATPCFFFFLTLLLLFIFMSNNGGRDGSWRPPLYLWAVARVVGVVLIAGLVVVLVRTTIVTSIMVLVMMAFAGKRRRVLAVEGRKITGDVALQLLKVVMKERSIVAVACATFLSSMAMVWVA
ncbi:hypothetical protein OSB04_004718 [Centaurea solstitialis]|uniref:Uncharacterized protein n=1 Tax=Centaurea solstitialis TaxID=347529 RepID=A0AA38TEL6_9ASTR|nr:hypothetical protein OSB04_004718 [Centaurea solstitialis]